jgi:pilus assembly protein CpaB
MLQMSRPILLTVAFALALVTTLIVRSWVYSAREQSVAAPIAITEAPKGQPKMVLVAGQPLPAGHFLKAEDFAWQSWPDERLLPVYILQGSRTTDSLVGSVVRTGIAAGEPITAGRLVQKGDRGFLAAVLKPGFRAITVALTSNAGLSGLVVPGDHVDVILTAQVPGADKEPPRRVAETVLEDIRVLAIDQKLDDQASEAIMAHTATLEVTPKQAEVVALVGEMGKLAMTLRSVGSTAVDASEQPHSMTWDSDATDIGQKPHTPDDADDGAKVSITRGTADTVVDFSKVAK